LVAVAVYIVAVNNFFVADDFIWLYRSRMLPHNIVGMFRPDVMYFDPLVYLSFYLNYSFTGLEPTWYHAVDLAIHAINSALVYRLVKCLQGDDRTALYAGVLFASSFAIADAVLWPSSRVDLVATLFSLGTLILFVNYIQTNDKRFLWISCLMFALSLAAKGTPVVLPLVLIWLVLGESGPKRSITSVIPFVLLVVIFFVLLKWQLLQAALPVPQAHFNTNNIALALGSLFIPEYYLHAMNPTVTGSILAVILLILGVVKFSPVCPIAVRRVGLVVLSCSLLPMLALGDFKLVAANQDLANLLASPSHRVYLASVGSALLGGGVLRCAEGLFCRFSAKFGSVVVALCLVGMVMLSAREVAKRDLLWEKVGDKFSTAIYGLSSHRDKIVNGGLVALVNFPGSPGFANPMFRTFLDLNDITVLMARSSLSAPENIDLLKNADRSCLFVLGSDQIVYDLSDQFRQKLHSDIQAIQNQDKEPFLRECERTTGGLNRLIANLIR
jgi:hypothetical protein